MEHQAESRRGKLWSGLAGLLIVILPKCPFCILAYSSAVTLCSGTKLYNHSPAWTSWISIGLAGFILLTLLWNYKGSRTLLAIALAFLGSALVLSSELYTGELATYYAGAVLLLFGIWVNGSFRYVVAQFKKRFLRLAFKIR
jgi:CHASE2 domain-containing sensor protein